MDMLKRVRRRRRRVLESCKTLLIVLLAVSAVYLAARALVYSGLADTGPSGWVGTLLSLLRGEAQPPAATPENGQPGMAAQPVRIAIHSGTERFAVQYDQGAVAFEPLLTDGVGSFTVFRRGGVGFRRLRVCLRGRIRRGFFQTGGSFTTVAA